MTMNILENKGNITIIKENNIISLFSYKTLVSKYNIDTREFENVPYTFINVYGNSCSQSPTTSRHINKFKKFIETNF